MWDSCGWLVEIKKEGDTYDCSCKKSTKIFKRLCKINIWNKRVNIKFDKGNQMWYNKDDGSINARVNTKEEHRYVCRQQCFREITEKRCKN